jgi:hypothetical protein
MCRVIEKTFTTIMPLFCLRCGVYGSVTAAGVNKMSFCLTNPLYNMRWAVSQFHCEMRIFQSPRRKVSVTVKKLEVARRGLYSTAALYIADCALAPNVVPSFISRGATTPSVMGALY